MTDFTKEFFQTSWGESGYYENFSYGVGIEKVCEKCLYPFFNLNHNALEIGPGGGSFTKRMVGRFKNLVAVDVIKMPAQFSGYKDFYFIELPDQCYDLPDLERIDFCFSYNVFCHLSNKALTEYFMNINRVLNPGADFVFMLANYEHTKKNFSEDYHLGEMTPVGHFAQSDRTIDVIVGKEWEIVRRNMIPEHRDIIVHLKKK